MTKLSAKPRATRSAKASHGVRGGSGDANRLAVAILEVLAGVRTPADAALALSVSLARYYQLETRALEGLVAACEPRSKGKQPTLEGKLAALERELLQAQRECARQQALVRVSQRSVGLKPAAANGERASGKDRAGRRKRRPTARALKAAQALRTTLRTAEPQAVQQQAEQPAAPEALGKDRAPVQESTG